MADVDAIIKAQKEKKLVIGFKESLSAVKSGKAQEIFVTKTCSDIMKRQLKGAAEVAKVKLTELTLNSEELSAQLKKPFTITVAVISSK